MHKLTVALIGLAALAMASPESVSARTLQPTEIAENSCKEPIRRWEAKLGIPGHLLEAVALAESGRWDADEGASFAWPWTVTSGAEGTFHDSKAAAIHAVEALQANKVKNIDVGCMQINLRYHPDAFADLDEAFDPLRNVEYAARYLARLYGVHKSWPDAAAAYHSTRPDLNRAYKIKVIALWDGIRKTPRSVTSRPSHPPARFSGVARQTSAVPGEVDHGWTTALNQRLRESRAAARAAERTARALEERAALRNRQLDAWRQQQFDSLELVHMSAMRRAEMELRRQQLIDTGTDPAAFAERRRNQLNAWRTHGAWTGNGSDAGPRGLSRAAYR